MPHNTFLFFSKVLSFSPCRSQGYLFLQKESWISVKSYMLNEPSFLLCELLCSLVVWQWQSPTVGRAEGGGALQRCSWAKPAQPPGSNLFINPPKECPAKGFLLLEKTLNGLANKWKKWKKAMHHVRGCQVVCFSLSRSYVHSLLPNFGKAECLNVFLHFQATLLAYCLAQGASPIANGSGSDRSWRQRRRCNADRRFSPPKSPAAIHL